MKNVIIFLSFLFVYAAIGQTPLSNFSISPNPACSQNAIQITDLSSNSPTAWSYTFTAPGPGGVTTSALQNPTVTFNLAGTYTIVLVANNSSGAGNAVTQTLTVLASPFAQVNPQLVNNCPGGNPVTFNIFSAPGSPLTYSWSTGATTPSITVSPSVTTTYSATITGTNGCSVTRTSTINVAQATVNIASVPASICPGSSSTLTATGTQPGPFTYSWSTGATTRTISTTTPGTYTVTVVNNNGCSAVQTYSLGTSSTLSLTTTSNPTILCAGNTATLRVQGATSYTWSTGASTPGMTVNPVSSTTYTVYGELGACTGAAVITLSVNVTPTITAAATPSSICAGNVVSLSAGGAITYTWNPGGSAQSLTVSPSVNTSYVVSGNNPGCPTRSAAVSVIVNPNPVLNVSTSSLVICAGENVAIAVSGANSYSWSNGSNASVLILTPTITTTFTVSGTNAANCTASAVFTQSVSECLGLNSTQEDSFALRVFPNPNNGIFTLTCDNNANILITDITGATVLISEQGLSSREINMKNFESGIYFLRTVKDNEFFCQKIIIAH